MFIRDRILSAYKFLAQKEGVFVEPASAASVAGLFMLGKDKFFSGIKNKQIKIVCTLTGHGLKDPQTALKAIKNPPVVKASLEAVVNKAGL